MSITFTPIQDGQDGLGVRNELNDVISALVQFVNDPAAEDDQSRWEENGATGISPKDNKKPIMTSFEAVGGTVDFLTVSDELKVTAHSGHTGIKPAGFNADGELVPWDMEGEEETPEGFTSFGPGLKHVTGTEHNINPVYPHIMVGKFEGTGANVDIYLPNANTSNGLEVTVRKISHEGNSVTVYVSGAEVIPTNIILNDAFESEITTTTKGAWIKLRCDGMQWWVTSDSGNWQLATT